MAWDSCSKEKPPGRDVDAPVDGFSWETDPLWDTGVLWIPKKSVCL